MSEGDTVLSTRFGGKPYKEPAQLMEELHEVIRGYNNNNKVPLVMVLGVLRLLEHAVLEEQLRNME